MDGVFEITGAPAPVGSFEGQQQQEQQQQPEQVTEAATEAAVPAATENSADDGTTFGLFGANAKFIIYSFDELKDAALSNDCGWIGIDDDDRASIPAEAPSERTIVVFVVPKNKLVVGYGIILGACDDVAEMKSSIRRDLPRHWKNVVRVAWIRAGEVPFSMLADKPTEESILKDAASTHSNVQGTSVSKFVEISTQSARTLTQSCEEAAKLRLPRDVRNYVGTQSYGQINRETNEARRQWQQGGGRRQNNHNSNNNNNNFQQQGGNQQRNDGGWNNSTANNNNNSNNTDGYQNNNRQQYQQQVQQPPQSDAETGWGVEAAPPQQVVPQQQQAAMAAQAPQQTAAVGAAPATGAVPDVSQFPDYESYVKYQEEMAAYVKAMEEYNNQLAATAAGGAGSVDAQGGTQTAAAVASEGESGAPSGDATGGGGDATAAQQQASAEGW